MAQLCSSQRGLGCNRKATGASESVKTPEAPAVAEPVMAPRADDTVKDAVKIAQRAVAAFPVD